MNVVNGMSHVFSKVSGVSRDLYYAIGYRYEGEDFQVDQCESWLFRTMTGGGGSLNRRTWLTGLWCSPQGTAYVTDSVFRKVIVYRNTGNWTSEEHELPATLDGIWGVDDACVWAWGSSAGDPVLFHWDGARWTQVPSPGEVLSMHGTRRDLVFAVGMSGLVARWNGTTWTTIRDVPATTHLASVFVVDEQEVWACGPRGQLLAGSSDGWREILTHGSGLLSVAKWQDKLWLGVSDVGLCTCTLADSTFVPVRAGFPATSLDARGDLLFASHGMFGGSIDGSKFRGMRASHFHEVSAGMEAAWRLAGA